MNEAQRVYSRLQAKLEQQALELAQLRRDYAQFEEMAPPDIPRQEFVHWCFDAWAKRCEREAIEKRRE